LRMYRSSAKRVKAHEDSIWAVDWAKGTNYIVTGSVDESCKVWNPEELGSGSCDPLHSFSSNELAVVSVATSGDGKRAVTSSMDGFLRVYDIESGKQELKFDAEAEGTWTVAHHPQKAIFASGTKTGNVVVYNAENGQVVKELENKDGKFTMSVAFSPDGRYLACGDVTGLVQVYNTETGQPMTIKHSPSAKRHVKAVRCVSFTNDSKLLLTGSDDSYVSVQDVQGGQAIASISAHRSWVLGIDASPSVTEQFATSGADKKVKIWDMKMKECLHSFDAHDGQAWGVKYNEEGNGLVSVGEDAAICTYSIQN